jgi:hypothetical protein
MKKYLFVPLLFGVLSCSNNTIGPTGPSTDVWKIVSATEYRAVISQNPELIDSTTVTDTHAIAELGTDFGYVNYLSFLSADSLKIYGSAVWGEFSGAYTRQDSTITTVITLFDSLKTDSLTLHLEYLAKADGRMVLEYPGLTVNYYGPGMGMAYVANFESLHARDSVIATLDTAFHAATMDSIVYSIVTYYYTKQ